MKRKILVVDDSENLRLVLEDILADAGYDILQAVNGNEAVSQAVEQKPGLILLDQNMPVADGFTALRRIRSNAATQNIPIIMLTAENDRASINKAIELNANDYLLKPFNKKTLIEKVSEWLHEEEQWQDLPAQPKSALNLTAKMINEALTEVKKDRPLDYAEIKIASQAIGRVLENQGGIKELLQAIKDHHNPTFVHSVRMAIYFFQFAEAQELPAEEKRAIIEGALVHDVGMARINVHLLQKKEPLTFPEWDTLKRHVDHTVATLQKSGISGQVLLIAKYHHERLDGSGFPNQLKGNQVGLLGKMASITEAYTTMIDNFSFQPTFTAREALKALRWPPGQFDNDLLTKFTNVINSSE